jgi:hypothetical protein
LAAYTALLDDADEIYVSLFSLLQASDPNMSAEELKGAPPVESGEHWKRIAVREWQSVAERQERQDTAPQGQEGQREGDFNPG